MNKHPFKIREGGLTAKKETPKKKYTGQDNFMRELVSRAWLSHVADRNKAIDKERAEAKAKR